ncbi:hypothetical protein DL98DRAFT_26694 [Cadophora sp. DSE1049]|nr:hypothetical protein DL98DRAFT_26694 [Cadophora sp. DSE1049]
MDGRTAENVLATTSKVADYGGAIATVLTNHAISAKKIPRGFEGAINLLNATVTTLQQVSSHLSAEAAASPNYEKQVLSRQGLEYVQLLATECAATFVKIPSIMADACLDPKELKAKRKLEKKSVVKGDDPKLDMNTLQLNKAAFTESIENSDWLLAGDPLEDIIKRLHEIQLYLLLVHQVVSLGQLSWIGSSSQVDVKRVVDFHVRITRTADLIGIRSPGRTKTRSRFSRNSSSDSDSMSSLSDSDSDTDSDESDYKPKRNKKSSPKSPPFRPLPGIRGPPAPPPLVHPVARNFPPPPPANWVAPGSPKPAGPGQSPIIVIRSSDTAKPPAYSEAHKAGPSGGSPSSGSSTVRATVEGPSKAMTVPPQNVRTFHASAYPPEKEASPEAKDSTTPTILEPRLFKKKSNGLGFKIKSIFRSKQSLAEEMKKSLGDSDSHLRAFVLRGHETRLVPHSAFHTLEATHMRTILAQLNDNTWYKTFTMLNQVEHQTVERLVYPFVMGKMHERDIVVLKVLQENKPSAWMVLLRDILKSHPVPQRSNDRVILAIMREKLLDGKPLPPISFGPRGGLPLPPPPPPGFGCPPIIPTIRPPPTPSNHHRMSRISDLSMPTPPLPMPSSMPCPPLRRGPPGPPALGARSTNDKKPLTDHAAMMALTTYTEYTLRLVDPLNPSSPRTWARVAVTPESAEHSLLLQRIQAFHQKGGNIIEKKLRMNDDQNKQLTRLMDELQAFERDSARFEWCWAEISLYNDAGEIMLVSQASSATATTIHLIAKRIPKPSCKPIELYNSLMEPRPPIARPQPPSPVVITRAPSPRRKKSKKCRSAYISDSSDSDRDSGSSSCDRERGLRLALRKDRARKMNRKKNKKTRINWIIMDSDSDSDASGSESEEDVIQVKLDLKKGDDVVKTLLDLWTPQGKGEGEGKLAV